MNILNIIIAYILLLSIISSILKIISFNFFIENNQSLIGNKINYRKIYIFSIVLVASEILIPLYVYTNYKAITFLILLYSIITIILFYSYRLNEKQFCGCHGIFLQEPINIYKISENILYILIMLIFLVLNSENTINIFHIFSGFLILVVRNFITLVYNSKNDEKSW